MTSSRIGRTCIAKSPSCPTLGVTIDLERVSADEWIAYDPDDGEQIIGRGETGPRAEEDYCRRVAEHLEDRGEP